MSSKNETLRIVEWRRSKVLELRSQGNSQPEIFRPLQISLGTVNKDLSQTTSTGESKDSHKRQTARRISELYDWNKPGVKDVLGDCKQI